MRIITKFRDYYDSAAAYGQDKAVVYVRKTIEITPPLHQRRWDQDQLFYNSRDYSYELGVMGFCGKFYPFIKTTHCHPRTYNRTEKVFWLFEEFLVWMKKVSPDANWDTGYRKRGKSWKFDHFRKHFHEQEVKDEEIFHEHQTPVVCLYDHGLTIINPKLSDFEFYRIFDAYKAHQEIAMYVGGVLNQPNANMIQISNDVRIAKHGYDKFSFRADKGSGPKRKRK